MKLDTTREELETYLKNLKDMISDPGTKLIIKDQLDKNFKFKYLYDVDEDRIIKELIKLKIKDFYQKKASTNKNHLGELLYIWNPTSIFTDAVGCKRKIKLYIKTYINKKEGMIVVISFHEFNDLGE